MTPQQLSWKVVALVLLACYFLPGVFIAALVATGLEEAARPYLGEAVSAFLAFAGFLLPPLAGGYLAARLAPASPWRHVLVVGLLGAVLSLLAFRATPRAMVAYVLASIVLAAFGGVLRLGLGRSRPGH